jgi:hypothetical protein
MSDAYELPCHQNVGAGQPRKSAAAEGPLQLMATRRRSDLLKFHVKRLEL